MAAPPLRPSVGFCIQAETTGNPPGRWYVNMCKHKMVEMPLAPSGKPVTRDHILTHGIGNLQVPFDMGSFRKLKERAEGAKRTTYCIDVVFSPLMIQLFMDDDFCNSMTQYRPFVINLALNRIEESVGVKLSAQKVKLVKSFRYKDGEDADGTIPREFTDLPGDADSFDMEMPPKPPAADDTAEPLIQDVTPGARKPKPAIKKGFLNKGSAELYPNGSGEGVLPENAGDPMGWMPKKLRNTCKIVDCNSPEYQEHEKKKKAAEEQNAMTKEFNDNLKSDMDKWCKMKQPERWGEDLPEGTDEPTAKYDVDYSRFDNIADVEESPTVEERDWYYDAKGQRHQIQKKTIQPSTAPHETEPETHLKKGFLDSAKKPLYPKGSEQAKAPPDEAQLIKELGHLMGPTGDADALGPKPNEPQPRKTSVSVKVPEYKPPEFTLTQVPGGLQLVVSVPGLASMKDVSLDVIERRASLAFPASVGLKPLQVELPEAVIPVSAKAKFSKKTHQITISLPTAA